MKNHLTLGFLVSFLFLLASCGGGTGDVKKEDAIVTTVSKSDFFTTIGKLQGAIAANDLVLLKEYNVQAMMKMVDKNIESFMTFQTFHPKYGRVLIESDPDAFVSTPLSFAVRQRGERVEVVYRKPSDTYRIFGVPSSLTDELDKLFSNIVTSAAQ